MEQGYRGGALNRAARLCALAKAGDVLATEAVTDLAGKAEGVAYGLRRQERLKGFERPVRVVEVHPGDSGPGREWRRRARRALVGTRPRLRLGAVAAIAVVAAIVAVVSSGGGGGGGPTFNKDEVALLDAATLKPVAALDTGGEPRLRLHGFEGAAVDHRSHRPASPSGSTPRPGR